MCLHQETRLEIKILSAAQKQAATHQLSGKENAEDDQHQSGYRQEQCAQVQRDGLAQLLPQGIFRKFCTARARDKYYAPNEPEQTGERNQCAAPDQKIENCHAARIFHGVQLQNRQAVGKGRHNNIAQTRLRRGCQQNGMAKPRIASTLPFRDVPKTLAANTCGR